jgi:hypothetical protein
METSCLVQRPICVGPIWLVDSVQLQNPDDYFVFSMNRSARVTVIRVNAQTANQILVTHSRKRL